MLYLSAVNPAAYKLDCYHIHTWHCALSLLRMFQHPLHGPHWQLASRCVRRAPRDLWVDPVLA